MFIRFRKVASDGKQPSQANAKIVCRGECDPSSRRCPMKPRCRWRISPGDVSEPRLAPYRLQVILLNNQRLGAAVKQEHVALLGEIDGYLLPDFFAGLEPAAVEAMKASGWERASLRARVDFWQGCKAKLKSLDNRLGPRLQEIRMAIHARIPWPMQAGVDRLELLDAEAEEKSWRGLVDWQRGSAHVARKVCESSAAGADAGTGA